MGLARTPKKGKELSEGSDKVGESESRNIVDEELHISIDQHPLNNETNFTSSVNEKLTKKQDLGNMKIVKDSEKEPMQDKETCKCNRRVKNNQDSIQCDLCEYWYHLSCSKITTENFKIIAELGDTIKWFCDKCKVEIENMIENNKFLKYQNIEFKKQNQMFKNKIQKFESDMNELKQNFVESEQSLITNMKDEVAARVINITGELEEEKNKFCSENKLLQEKLINFEHKLIEIQNDLKVIMTSDNTRKNNEHEEVPESDCNTRSSSKTINSDNISDGNNVQGFIKKIREEVEDKFEEEKEREKRMANLIIYNLPESNKVQPNERISEDTNLFTVVIKEELGLQQHFEIGLVTRLGTRREDGKPRPLLVRLASEKEKWFILGRSKNLRNSTKYGILYLAKDMTKEERKEDFKIRQELAKKRENGDNSWYIKSGKVTQKISTSSNSTLGNFIPSRIIERRY